MMHEPAICRQVPNTAPVLLTASIGCAMTVLDSNVVAVILPTIARDFDATFSEVQWVVGSYVLLLQ